MLFSDEHITTLRNYDFYKKDKLDGMNDGLRTVKAWGDYKRNPPFVSVIVTTYKRPHYLKLALESIIRQNFNNYEIIVVDNECADIDADTDTQKLIKELANPKIVYFRNLDPMNGRMDRGASLARGEWICFLHDDDMLAANHLETMTAVVKSHSEINFLSCDYRTFRDEDLEKIKSNEFVANNRHDGRCREAGLQEGVFFNQGSWPGGLIRRRLYAEMGGMPKISTGCSDQIMCSKFIYWYSGFYRLKAPLCFYRISNSQISSKIDNWFNTFISDYFFSRYALTKITGIPKFDYEQLCFAFVCELMKSTENIWGLKFDLREYARKCGIKKVEDDVNIVNQYIRQWGEYEKEIRLKYEQRGFEIVIDKVAKFPY